MSVKSELNAMKYLADKKPNSYKIVTGKRYGETGLPMLTYRLLVKDDNSKNRGFCFAKWVIFHEVNCNYGG